MLCDISFWGSLFMPCWLVINGIYDRLASNQTSFHCEYVWTSDIQDSSPWPEKIDSWSIGSAVIGLDIGLKQPIHICSYRFTWKLNTHKETAFYMSIPELVLSFWSQLSSNDETRNTNSFDKFSENVQNRLEIRAKNLIKTLSFLIPDSKDCWYDRHAINQIHTSEISIWLNFIHFHLYIVDFVFFTEIHSSN